MREFGFGETTKLLFIGIVCSVDTSWSVLSLDII